MDRAWVSRDEAPINHAQLRCTSAGEDSRGTLFVTTHQVVWRVPEAGWPEGAGFQVRLEDLKLVGRRQGETEPGVFALGMELRGQVGALHFRLASGPVRLPSSWPRQCSRASKMRERRGAAR